MPQAFFRWLFSHCVFAGHLPCFLSQSSSIAFQVLSQPRILTFKTLGFKPCLLQELTKFGRLPFQANCYWDSISACALPYASLSLALLYDHGSLPTTVDPICFSPKLCFCTFYLLCSMWPLLFSPFSCSFFLSVFRSISGVFRII